MSGTDTRRDADRTRERILEAARHSFARYGYAGSTVRAIAAAAGVAPNLITRYFGGKPGLFEAATAEGMGVEEQVAGPVSGLGLRIASKVVARWEAADDRDPLVMMLRSAGSSEEAARRLADVVGRRAVEPMVRYLMAEKGCPADEAEALVAGVSALISGVLMHRYVVGLDPVARADPATLVAWLGDRLQRLVDLPPGAPRLVPGATAPGT